MQPDSPWLQTLGGGALDLCDPKPEQICFRTIARVLSRVPRFGGHTESGVLSVGQHCLEGAAAMRRDGHSEAAQVAFLLHDAHEAYIGDIATPVAQALAAVAAHEGFNKEQVASIQQRDADGNYAASVVKDAIATLKFRIDQAIHQAAGVTVDAASAVLVHEYDRRMCVTEREHRMAPPPREWELQAPVVEGCDLWHWSAGTVEKCYLAALKEYGVRI